MKNIPETLKDHILPFNWEVRKVWALHAPILQIGVNEIDYLLELPLWSSKIKSGMLFDLRPIDLLNNPSLASHQFDRVMKASIEYPMDFMDYNESRWILDGVHRLAKVKLLNINVVKIRLHKSDIINKIQVAQQVDAPERFAPGDP